MLFAAFLIGSLLAYLYSSTAGDPEDRAYLVFTLVSPLFAVVVTVLLSGINIVFSIYTNNDAQALARHVSYLVVLFSVVTILDDLITTSEYFHLQPSLPYWLFVLVPLLAWIVVMVADRRGYIWRNWVRDRTFRSYLYTAIIFSFTVASMQTNYNTVDEAAVQLESWIPYALIGGLALIALWGILLYPKTTDNSN